MAKMNIEITKSFGVLKAKATMKERVEAVIQAALLAEFGRVGKVRINSPTTGKGENQLAVVCADITEDGGVFDGCLTIKLTAKDWCDRVGEKQTKPAWSYDDARDAYDAWEAETEAKNAEKEKTKAANAAKAKELAEKRKAEAEAKKKAKEEEGQ